MAVKVYLAEEEGKKFIEKMKGKKALFVCTIGSTETAKIPGISAAGKVPELTDYTPPADVELVEFGECRSIDAIPVTPEGIPTPAIITWTAVKLTGIPMLVADAGVAVKPKLPFISLGGKKGGNIAEGKGVEEPEKIYENARIFGQKIADVVDIIILGESIPGGTTTTLGTLTALGYEADGRVSSSMPSNPHNLKAEVVRRGLERAGAKPGDFAGKPFDALRVVGDPVHIAMAGVTAGATSAGKIVLLAGGTQMSTVLALLAELHPESFGKIAIGTTRWVAEDKTSDITGLVKQICERKKLPTVPILGAQLDFSSSRFEGLQAYEKGVVKEGVGAGGTAIWALINGVGLEELVREIEKNYEKLIRKKQA